MKRIALWVQSRPEDVPDIAIIRHKDFSDFHDMLEAGLITRPARCFRLSQSTEQLEEHFLLHLYFQECRPEEYSLPMLASESHRVHEAWHQVCFPLQRWEIGGFSYSCDKLVEYGPPVFSHLSRIADLLKRYFERVHMPLLKGALFGPTDWKLREMWWKARLRLIDEVLSVRKDLDKSKDRSQIARKLYARVNSIAKRLEGFARLDTADKHFEMSSYCYGLAQRALLAHRIGESFLLLHRALDFYFQFLGLREGIVLETARGLRYGAGDPTNKVGLVGTYDALVGAQYIVPNSQRSRFLHDLNMIRNELLLTHGASSAPENLAAKQLEETKRIIEDIQGDTRWRSTVLSYFPPLPLEGSDIFEAVADIDIYFEEVCLNRKD